MFVLKPAELGEEYYNKAFGEGKVADEKSYREEVRKMIEAGLEGDQNYRFTIDAEKVALMRVQPDFRRQWPRD